MKEASPFPRIAPDRRYVLISPCRDEARYMRATLESVAAQSIPPALWIVVDDGSSDESPAILAEYASQLPYLRIITRPNRGYRKLGGGVIDAFYAGYESLQHGEFSYLCKLDLDLNLPPHYFRVMIERMESEPRLGTCSGKPWFRNAIGQRIQEACGSENSVGMAKFYRSECFEQIGGFVRELMWDGIDCHRCRMLGWIAVSWDDEAIAFEHLRPMGTSHKNWWTGRARHGSGQYFMGTTPLYLLASAAFRTTQPPVAVGGLAMIWGYARSFIRGEPRYKDLEFRSFVRRYQWRSLLRGKRRVIAAINEVQAKRWHPKTSSVRSLPKTRKAA